MRWNMRALGTVWSCLVVAAAAGCKSETTAPAAPQLPRTIQLAPSNSGDQQTGPVGTTLPQPLRVLVSSGSVAVAGVAVRWTVMADTVAALPGSLSAGTTMTDAAGIASVSLTLGTLPGPMAILASIPAESPDTVAPVVTFTAVATPGPASRLGFSVQPLNVFAGRPFLRPVQVAALDLYGNLATDFGGPVTVSLAAGGSLAGITLAIAAHGTATFPDLNVPQSGSGYLLTASASGLPTATSAPFDVVAPGPGRIAFVSDRDGNQEVYSVNADGSGVVRLTDDPGADYSPAWSPDGTKIAFVSSRGGTSGRLYTMNADGSGVTPLTTSNDREPTWSHDGTRFAAARLGTVCGGPRGCAPPRIIVGNADGSSVVLLSSGTYPAWSPDGRIAFSSANDIYVMNGDGSGLTKLTTDPSADLQPAWSPDGKKIAFLSNRGGVYDLYVMNADGTGAAAVTADSATEGRATWSPDGTRMAFESNRGGIYQIYVMNADGSGVVRLTNGHDVQPAWAP